MMRSGRVLIAAAAAAVASALQPVAAPASDGKLGNVHFETSCTQDAAAAFDRAMLYQHSFWYRASGRAFNEALKADANCGIAYWGIALSLLWNPHSAPPAKNLTEGAAALARGREVGARTERERDYIAALSAMYLDHEKVDHRTRVLNYVGAMGRLATKYPADDEAQIQYALALNVGASPSDKTYSNQLKGAAILEAIWGRQPLHPGVAHYLIHLYDTPALAERGLAAARRYAEVAPDAPHALHMPSHIFTRVGDWQASINSNAASARAAKADGEAADELHASDYEVYAYLQLGEDARAEAIVAEMKTITGFSETSPSGPFALAASPARYAVERGDWPGASALEVRSTVLPQISAMTWFAKALGAARSGDTASAETAVVHLTELRDDLRTRKDVYWTEQVDIQTQVATAWARFSAGRRDEALLTLRGAADAEDKTDKAPLTPGPLAPARELYGAMLLESGDAAGALAAFEATLSKEPNRLNALLGAAKAAAASGARPAARRYYERVAAMTAQGDRPALAQARAYLTSGN